MEDSYKTIEKPAEGIYRDKGSRFLAFGYPVENESEISEILGTIKKKYHNARHHCYAYRLAGGNDLFRMNDGGEPSGTAGKPIYGQLVSNRLTNILVVVVRYFGGILLGTGGLIKAYRSATADMISHAVVITRHPEVNLQIRFPFEVLNHVMKILKDEAVVPENPEYTMICSMNLKIRKSSADRIAERLRSVPDVVVDSL